MATDKSILNRLDNLEQMVLGLATRVNKIADSTNSVVKTSEIAKDWRKERDEWNKLDQDPEHYDERYKPRLDKYLAYIYIDKRNLPGGTREIYLLSKDWGIELVRTRSFDHDQEKAVVCVSGVVDTSKFEKKMIKFIVNSRLDRSLSRLDDFLDTFQAAIYNLSKGGPLRGEDMYEDPEHDFRALEFEINNEYVLFNVTNLRYSYYGSMEENEPVYEETFAHPVAVVVIDEY